jgi:hypothetical protein
LTAPTTRQTHHFLDRIIWQPPRCRLFSTRFVYLVSKCGENVERKTLEWLKHHDFYELTEVPASNVRFCRQRKDKAAICEELGVSYFVDDRLEVLSYLTSVSNLFLFNPEPKEKARFAQYLDGVTEVHTWAELVPMLLNQRLSVR